MPQDLLQGEQIASVHDEVTGKGMPEHVCSLALGQLDAGAFQGNGECLVSILSEDAADPGTMLLERVIQVVRYSDGAYAPVRVP